MYNDPQGSYPPPQPNPQWDGNINNGTQNFYPSQPQNPAPQWGGNGAANFQPDPYPTVQNFTPQAQWGNGTANFQQSSYPPQNQASAQPGFVYAGPSRRSGLVPSRGVQKNNLSMVMIGGATALALIIGLALFVVLSNQGQKPSTPVVQTDVATPTATPDTTTPTPEATTTPIPTPTLAATPTTDTTTTTTTTPAAYIPPPATAQQPVPTPKPAVPTPMPTATPTPVSFTYDYNPINGTLLTTTPANFCAPGQEAQRVGAQCVADFSTNAGGYVVTCKDGVHVSHNGGNAGACSLYKGEGKKWYKHSIKK